jgi:2-iminobutanoate/2-iminopropanoate deaminase
MTRDAVTSDQLPPSGLPFSAAVRGGGLLFLSGQVAQDPATGELVDGDIAQQAGAMNEVYRRHFTEPYPARTAIGVAALPLGAAVEMDVVAG